MNKTPLEVSTFDTFRSFTKQCEHGDLRTCNLGNYFSALNLFCTFILLLHWFLHRYSFSDYPSFYLNCRIAMCQINEEQGLVYSVHEKDIKYSDSVLCFWYEKK
jgi:hypothetical protein